MTDFGVQNGGNLTAVLNSTAEFVYVAARHRVCSLYLQETDVAESRRPDLQSERKQEFQNQTSQVTKSAYQELLDGVSDAVLDSAPDGRIIFVNAAACRITSYPREALLA